MVSKVSGLVIFVRVGLSCITAFPFGSFDYGCGLVADHSRLGQYVGYGFRSYGILLVYWSGYPKGS